MPIQWSKSQLTGPYALAQVISGEAATPAGQFAVASVMYNRMTNAGPYVGGGSGDIAAVVTPSQFNGWSNTPSSYSQTLANSLWNGDAPPGGSTGNATFFAAPDSANAAWANPNTAAGQAYFASGTNIAGNTFSDNQGPASGNFQAPQYGGTEIASGPHDAGSGAGFGSGDSVTGGGVYDPYSGDYTSIYGDPSTAFQTPGATTTASGDGGASGAGTGQGPFAGAPSTTGSGSMSGDVGQGQKISAGLQQGTLDAVTSWIGTIMGGAGNAVTSSIKAFDASVAETLGGIGNWFIRGLLILLGIVLLIAVVWHLMDPKGEKTAVIMRAAAA